MKKILIGIIALLVILILAAIIIPFLIPSSVYKSTIQDQLTERLGRAVTINGDVKISPLPSLKVSVANVDIDNPDGFSANYFAQMESLDVKIKLLPLLSKKVEISAFELISPTISLEKLGNGEMNWVLGTNTKGKMETTEGPFKRDGRYSDIDASIGTFVIENGAINFSDATKDRNHKLKDVNVSFSMPSFDSEITAKGDLILDGIAADIDLTLETPSSFLKGQKTPVRLKLDTILGNVSARGYFIESEEIHFAFDLGGTLKDLNPLARFFPSNLAMLEITDSVEFSGNYQYDADGLTAKGADVSVSGPILQSRFTGDAKVSKTFGGTGNLELSISDLPKLAKILSIELPTKDVVQSADIKTILRLDGDIVTANDIVSKFKGDGLDVDFSGSGSFGDKPTLRGNFSSQILSAADLANRMDIDNPQLAVLGPIDASGQIELINQAVKLKLDKAVSRGDNLSANYTGNIELNDKGAQLNGQFDSKIVDMASLAQILQIETPFAAAIGSLSAKGDISGKPADLTVTNLGIETKDGSLNGSYTGSASINEVQGFTLEGAFLGDIPRLSNLAEVTDTPIPYAKSVGRVKTSGQISGKANDLRLSEMLIDLSEGELNGNFDGEAQIKDGFVLDGNLTADIPSARNLTRSTTGVELPKSTQAGEIYERVALSGSVYGDPSALKFSSADLSMDAVNGQGEFNLDLTTEKPTLSGTLDMGQIDFRPYMAAYSANAGDGLQPWSEIPYNFTALRVMDGDYILKTPEVIFGPLTFGQTDLNTNVRNGVMTARLPKVNLYGGLGVLTATLDASGEIPQVKLAVTLEDIRSNALLASLANFTKLEGSGHTLLEISGEGRTQGEIMRSLDGYGNFEVLGGVIKGVDLSKFLTGIDQTLTQRVLPSGIGEKYATKFDDMVGKFKIEDGVISIDTLSLKALGVLASGSGKLDIGNQSVDFGLRPRLTGATAGDVGKFGIPLRFKGKWGNIKPGPDYDMLEKIAIEKAKIKAREEIEERIGEGVGNVLGGLLGVPKETAEPEAESELPPSQSEKPPVETEIVTPVENHTTETEEAEPTPPDTPEEVIDENKTPEGETEDKSLEEEILDKALGGLFGGKKD